MLLQRRCECQISILTLSLQDISLYPSLRPFRTWQIVTHGPSVSPFHSDQAGRVTAILCVYGEKICAFAPGPTKDNIDEHVIMGPRDVATVSLREGDICAARHSIAILR